MDKLTRLICLAGFRNPESLPGYKTLVDPSSEKNLKVPDSKTNDTQWPVEVPQSREKERVLPAPSDHNKVRDVEVGPTYYNKSDNSTGEGYRNRTKPVPGDQYGHPSKDDYGYPRRRKDVTAGVVVSRVQIPRPQKRQKETRGLEKRKLDNWYDRHKPQKRLQEKKRYRTEGRTDPDRKRYRRLYEANPGRFKRQKPNRFTTPAERTKAWRKEQETQAKRRGLTPKEQEDRRRRDKGLKAKTAADLSNHQEGPTDWYTTTKKTSPPEQLDQNYKDKGDKGAPRRDKTKQEGESLRTPNLDGKPQKGLGKHKIEEKPNSGYYKPWVSNPGNGSGKVIPDNMGFTNHSQELGDSGSRPFSGYENAKVTASVDRIVMTWLRRRA